jgi:hypothetical protein
MKFDTESEAVAFCVERLRDYCSTIVTEIEVSHFRLDIGFRLSCLPAIPLAIEVKQFSSDKQIAKLADGVFQARDYARQLGTAAFIAPFEADGAKDFHADGRVAGAMLIAGQESVGALAFHPRNGWIRLVMAGQNVITMFKNSRGEASFKIHPKADAFLRFKNRKGSQTWRA